MKGGFVMKHTGNLKRMAAVTAAVLCLPVLPVRAEAQKQHFGEHVVWELQGDTLYLEGTGETGTGVFLPNGIPSGRPFSEETLSEWYNGAWPADVVTSVRSIVAAEGITRIGSEAFCLFPNLESVELPESVSFIADLAFMGCPKLKSVQIAPQTEIVFSAFQLDYALCDAQQLLILNDRLIDYCGTENTVLNVPENVTVIGENAFAEHAELQEINIPEGVTAIGNAAFSACTGLQSITLPPALDAIAPGTFAGCSALESLVIPETVTAIGAEAFSRCTALQTLSIPKTVQSVGENAFRGNLWLESAGDFVTVGDGVLYLFQGRQKRVRIPANAKTVCKNAVSGDKIVEVSIPAQVQKLAPGAVDCKNAVIAGTPGSAAAQYAQENGIPFRDITAAPPAGDDMTLDPAHEIWSFGNSAEVFGGDYALTDADRERLTALGVSTDTEKSWGGSCVGLSVTVILAKNGLLTPSILQTGAETLSQVEPREEIVSLINYYQCMQGGSARADALEADFVKFYRMLQIAENIPHGESPFLLTFATKTGSHAVVGYGKESGTWVIDGKVYDGRILVWDSNFPQGLHADSCLYFDSETFDYCIPYYGVHVADGAADNTAGIITVRNDLAALNENPHPLVKSSVQPGDFDGNGIVNIADAVLLARFNAEDSGLEPAMLHTDVVDLNADGTVDALDLAQLLRSLANLKD